MADETPQEAHESGLESEIRRHYITRSDVQEMLAPLSEQIERMDVALNIGQRLSTVEGGIQLIRWMVPALIGAATLIVLALRVLPQTAAMPVPDTTTTITTVITHLP